MMSSSCKMRFLILGDGQIKNQCCSSNIIFLTGCSSLSLNIDIELRYRIIFIMHLMNFYHLFLPDDKFFVFGPWSDLYELAFSLESDLSNSPPAFIQYSPYLLFMCSNFFLSPTNEFPLLNIKLLIIFTKSPSLIVHKSPA